MTSLVNIAAILVFALLVFAVVGVSLRLLIPSEPHRPATTERSRAGSVRRALTNIAGFIAFAAAMGLAFEVRAAYGSPFGERGLPTVEVVEVGDCERAPLGFGIARTCDLTSFRATDSEDLDPSWVESIEVATGAPVEPGDLVAPYSPSRWTAYVFLGSTDARWRPVSAEGRPNLDWLPTVTLFGATVLFSAFMKRRVAASP
ncbi:MULTISPECIES: hypothetical protein [Glycomyces]|uniref:Uncharacterized protein n=2 Tax=Glycomyces TaxID=58113 RepID=A0A9X3SWZ1_9ACTN|nr:hypothetical protein [Glycomyces lechevalierae]MDA1384556.1 hypothetical protein [Glycomyces lechevalierae]MDR7338195.1 hypothetical protein [Glycomyces lechevalierae]